MNKQTFELLDCDKHLIGSTSNLYSILQIAKQHRVITLFVNCFSHEDGHRNLVDALRIQVPS